MFILFQFLIGRLKTQMPDVTIEQTDESFNSL